MPNVERPYKAFDIHFTCTLHNHCFGDLYCVIVHQNKYERLGCGDYAHWDSSVLFDESKRSRFDYELWITDVKSNFLIDFLEIS
jgi:hypothetical protein